MIVLEEVTVSLKYILRSLKSRRFVTKTSYLYQNLQLLFKSRACKSVFTFLALARKNYFTHCFLRLLHRLFVQTVLMNMYSLVEAGFEDERYTSILNSATILLVLQLHVYKSTAITRFTVSFQPHLHSHGYQISVWLKLDDDKPSFLRML